MSENMKMLKLITNIGSEVSLLTRAPAEEIRKEIKDNVTSDWISLDAVDANEDHVDFEILRVHVVGFLIGRAHKTPAPNPSGLLVPRGVVGR